MSCHQNSGPEPEYKDRQWIIWKGSKIHILGEDTNKSEWHSWWNQEYIKFGECFLL